MDQILENQIALLKKCVEFYGDENNYKKSETDKSFIDMDNGFVAKTTLQTIQDLENQRQEIVKELEKLTNGDTSPENLLERVKKMIEENGR